ncbi:carbohydrate-binding domain-containing protein [Candidatus Saccharibacteria bacterium]|nr:carbohydrate-binding domain-containing protein [Candidatus Saccharibacteria bacterium]
MDKDANKWVVIFVVILSVLVTTILMNINHDNQSTSYIASTIDLDNGDTSINWDHYPTANINLSDSLQITKSGTYHLTGSLEDGNITIKAGVEGVVRLILDGVNIHNSQGPTIYCASGDDLVIELIGRNELSDGSTYSADYDADVTGTIYSKADLSFTGNGTLNLTASYQDGIISKDDLKFNSGTYNIIANDDGIRGKDSVYILDGSYTIDATADTIKSTNDTDQGKGFVMIENGNFKLTAGAKGIKATNNIIIRDGNYILNTYDDAIHSDDYISINGGSINIVAGDDGIHANRELIINDGKLIIAKAYEGLEAQIVTINDGEIRLTTTDDGINAGGGADGSSNNRPGASPFNADENCVLSVNGGNLYVNASGDGIDSNGWLYFNGGNVVVDGPTNNGNGALDAGIGIVMNGGEVIAIGASGMAESLGSSSSVNNVSIFLSSTLPAKTKITIKDSKGDTLLSHTSAKSFSHISFGSSTLELGNQYTLYLDDEISETFTISSTTTTVGQNNTGPGQQMMPGSRRQ